MKSSFVNFIQTIKSRLFPHLSEAKKRVITTKTIVILYIDRRPLVSFFALLAILVLAIILSSVLRRPVPEKKTTAVQPKEVNVYRIGSAPRVQVQAQIEKSGVITVTALTGGVVQKINVREGSLVKRGTNLVGLSTNYQGGNLLSAQRQIAQKQFQNIDETYPLQKDTIGKQKEIAQKSETNAEQLRSISAQSISDTQNIVNLNNTILKTLGTNLDQYNATNSAGVNNSNILTTQQLQSQFLSANNQLNQALRSTQYTSNNDNPQAQLSKLQRDITLQQLALQEKSLDLSREVSRLQLQVAQISEAMMFPSSPFPGTVQRVFVKVGQAVQPGTPLVLFSQAVEDDPIVAIAYVPKRIKDAVSTIEPSVLSFDNTSYEAYPSFVSQEAIQGNLYGIYYPIPDTFNRDLTDKGHITVSIPIGSYDTSAVIPFIPIDAVYQSQTNAYVFLNKNSIATDQIVTLGTVYGSYVEVKSGITSGDEIILDRNIITGDYVQIKP